MANKTNSSRKKKVLEPEILEPEEPIAEETGDSYQVAAPVATREHRIVTRYTERKPLDELDLTEENEPELPYPASLSPPDPIEAFLDGMGGSTARWDMVVYRLPKYWQDARTDPASRVRCGRIDFTEEYENEVQRRWARPNLRNDFVIVVKKNGQYHKQLPTFSCEPALPEERINQPDASNPPQSPPQTMYPVFYEESPQHNGSPLAPIDPMKQLKELLQMQKLMRDAIGPEQHNPLPAPALTDPDAILISSLASNDKFMDKISGGLVGKLIGKSGSDDDPSPWAVGMELVRSGQLSQIVQTVIREFMTPIRNAWGQNNGTQTMGAPTLPQQNAVDAPGNGSQFHQGGENAEPQALPQGAQSPAQAVEPIGTHPNGGHNSQVQNLSPEEQALNLVIDHCARKIPPQVAFTRLMNYADALNEQAPQYSIDGYIDMLATMTTDDVLEFVKTLPNGEQVASLPHAKGWTSTLQKLIKESQEGGEE